MFSRLSLFSLLLLALLLTGCGGGGGGGTAGDGPGSAPAPTVPTATLRLQNVLERAVPAVVTELRLTGYSSSGAVLYGPQTKAKAAVMEFTQVPVSVRQIQVEYL